jgi:trehalose-phosphatase
MTAGKSIAALPHALRDRDELTRQFGGRRPAVFLDYDGTLTPIVDRPDDAVISESMRAAVRALAQRCPVCVVSGRDRRVVQDLMGVEDLIVAGSHGFDIWSPTEGTLEHEADGDFEELIERVTERVREEADPIEGSLVEPKKASVALHYRLVAETDRPAIKPSSTACWPSIPVNSRSHPARWSMRSSRSSNGTRARPCCTC